MKNDIKKVAKKTVKKLPFAVEEIITKEKTLKQKLADQKAEISVLWTTVVVLMLLVLGQALVK